MSVPRPRPLTPPPADLSSVQLREGPPSLAELTKFYPATHTWEELKAFMKSGDLGLLKRHPVLQLRYKVWAKKIIEEHGSIVNYLVNVRLGWGTPPTENASPSTSVSSIEASNDGDNRLPYFTSTPLIQDVKIIFNDWPYSIPLDISHYLIWSRLPVVHPDLVHPSVMAQVQHYGLWGFSGIPEEELRTPDGGYPDVPPGTSPEERSHILAASHHTHQFVVAHWPEDEWEVAWFVNPPRLQSVKDLSHIHVFAKRK